MKQVNILVEGAKDFYFLHEFIRQRFRELFCDVAALSDMIKQPKSPYVVEAHAEALEVRFTWVNGVDNFIKAGPNICRPKGLLPQDRFASVIIADADSPERRSESLGGGHAERRRLLLERLGEKIGGSEVSGDGLFLFPDNHGDGDLETLMRQIVVDTEEHRDFFDKCWDPFDTSVKMLHFNPVSRKSMMNEYTAAFYAGAWEHNGINRAFSVSGLWDWYAPVLDPLYDFLNGVLFGDVSLVASCTP